MNNQSKMEPMKGMGYKTFGITMLISFLVMYIIMFFNIDRAEHYHTSLTRIYMALLMVSAMAVVMLLMMGKMYPNKKANTIIMLTGAAVFVLVLIGLRTQTPIGDLQYMKAMIPHHSSAILVSKNANIKDPEVKKLSEDIIKAQEKEIAEMEAIIVRMDK
jgi:uncharacterized protein (DUF305 family)